MVKCCMTENCSKCLVRLSMSKMRSPWLFLIVFLLFSIQVASYNCKESGCFNFGHCQDDGSCRCPIGFGHADCSQPLCGSPLQDSRPERPHDEDQCACSPGWGGLNCNVCQSDDACGPLSSNGVKASCINDPVAIKQSFMQCQVTNKGITDLLKERTPEVTLSCSRPDEACSFQFWIAGQQSFYCDLQECDFGESKTKAKYKCNKIQCRCMPGQLLCGQNGSIDLTDWFMDPEEGPSGPGFVSCDSRPANSTNFPCVFDESHMDQLIGSFFGDPNIKLSCRSGECSVRDNGPVLDDPYTLWPLGYIAAIVSPFVLFILIQYFKIRFNYRSVSLGEDDLEVDEFLHSKVSGMAFEKICYTTNSGEEILHDVNGVVNAGEVLAIMGVSGAGKTSLIDVLAGREKAGIVGGKVLVDGAVLTEKMKNIVGYVEQNDDLIPTLTVYETILFSASLRLPRQLSVDKKHQMVNEIMDELNLTHVAHQLIGDDIQRGISGGEKRRVSIACELVAGANILILDEPTSGLDAYNAYNVVETLSRLAKSHKRCVILSIHQPRSNIFSLFDRLLLMSHGRQVYSGKAQHATQYFEELGYKLPPGYNTADFLIDLTVFPSQYQDTPSSPRRQSEDTTPMTEIPSSTYFVSQSRRFAIQFSQKLQQSPVFQEVISQMEALRSVRNEGPHLQRSGSLQRASFTDQVRIISWRTWKNMSRDPRLLRLQYVIALFVALAAGYLFRNVTNDIAGFQNRMGLVFFVCCVFLFNGLSSVSVFSKDKAIFTREREKGYYGTSSYFLSQLLLDFVLLRMGPPLLLSLVLYPLVGFRVDAWIYEPRFILALILFNLNAASLCLLVSVVFTDVSVASLVGTMLMLFQMLFGGLLLNNHTFPSYLQVVRGSSFLNTAMEAMIVNEINGLMLKEFKYGLSIDVPGAVLLQAFGFNALGYERDVIKLALILAIHVGSAFIWLLYFVKQKK